MAPPACRMLSRSLLSNELLYIRHFQPRFRSPVNLRVSPRTYPTGITATACTSYIAAYFSRRIDAAASPAPMQSVIPWIVRNFVLSKHQSRIHMTKNGVPSTFFHNTFRPFADWSVHPTLTREACPDTQLLKFYFNSITTVVGNWLRFLHDHVCVICCNHLFSSYTMQAIKMCHSLWVSELGYLGCLYYEIALV